MGLLRGELQAEKNRFKVFQACSRESEMAASAYGKQSLLIIHKQMRGEREKKKNQSIKRNLAQIVYETNNIY